MTDDEFKMEVESLIEMLYNLRRIKDRNLRRWLKAEIRYRIIRLTKD